MLGFKRHEAASSGACTHEKALPRWDNVADTGREDRISRMYCPKCDSFVVPHEVAGAKQPTSVA